MASLAFKVIGIIGIASYAAAYVATRLRHVRYHRFRIVALPAGALPQMPRGYSWRLLSAEELAVHTIDVGPEVQRERFAAGLDCLAVFDSRGALAGVSWLATGCAREPMYGLSFRLAQGCAWDTGLWVPPEKRMGRAFAAVWAAIGEWMAGQELRWSLSSIADYNVASILSHRRLGAIDMGTVMVLRIGPVQLTLGASPMLRITHSKPDGPLPEFLLREPQPA